MGTRLGGGEDGGWKHGGIRVGKGKGLTYRREMVVFVFFSSQVRNVFGGRSKELVFERV